MWHSCKVKCMSYVHDNDLAHKKRQESWLRDNLQERRERRGHVKSVIHLSVSCTLTLTYYIKPCYWIPFHLLSHRRFPQTHSFDLHWHGFKIISDPFMSLSLNTSPSSQPSIPLLVSTENGLVYLPQQNFLVVLHIGFCSFQHKLNLVLGESTLEGRVLLHLCLELLCIYRKQ